MPRFDKYYPYGIIYTYKKRKGEYCVTVEFIYTLFQNATNGYCVHKYRDTETDDQITCVGYNLPTNKKIEYVFTCTPVKYKDTTQYDVTAFEVQIKKDKEHIVSYLSCGIIKGIGKKTAELIYEAHQENCLEILDKNPEELLKIKGISIKKLEKIKSSYIENRVLTKLAEEILPYGFSMNQISKIYARYKSESMDIIKANPYALSEIKGIPFKTVDDMALSKSIAQDSYERICAAAKQVIKDDMLSGNVCTELNRFGMALISMLHTTTVNRSNVCNYTIQMIKDKVLVYKKFYDDGVKSEYLYLPYTYDTERRLADSILNLLEVKVKEYKYINETLDKGDIILDDTQISAIKTSLSTPFSVITGGPGTGKTTILKKCVEICKKNNRRVILLSPTGKAARRMEESTGNTASTIHKYLQLGVLDDDFGNESEKEFGVSIDNATVFIDETSMLDLWVAEKTFSRLKENVSLVFVGDADQLPSVGPGAVLRDIIASNKVPVTILQYIHRQGDDAPNICVNAQNIKNGVLDVKQGDDFIYEEIRNLTEAEAAIIPRYIEDVKEYGLENVKCLCPYKKGAAGVYSLNMALQEALNPLNGRIPFQGFNNTEFRVGDPVIQLKNNDDVSNGDVGLVTYITEDEMKITFFSDTEIEYSKNNIDELQLAYAITIHKSQGSEYDSVFIPLSWEHKKMKKRRVLYTGITRGKKKVSLFSREDVLLETINNNAAELRNTNLTRYLMAG